jgi:hypothetical protein
MARSHKSRDVAMAAGPKVVAMNEINRLGLTKMACIRRAMTGLEDARTHSRRDKDLIAVVP